MPCAVAAGSWSAQLAMVTHGDSGTRRTRLRVAWLCHTCRPSPPDSGGDGCVWGACGRFQKLVASCRQVHAQSQLDPLRAGSCEGHCCPSHSGQSFPVAAFKAAPKEGSALAL